ncbi:MAG: glycerol kinase, partial [Eggerthellaceae bacterium]|nr:glycerol kinase [Eggerthellaceae bacterium]
MAGKYVIALDQGTTSSRIVLINAHGEIVDMAQRTFPQIYPHPGWVEHDPADILNSQMVTLEEIVQRNNLSVRDVAAIGITNQRETTMIWDRTSGKPVANAIVWQCRRTAPLVAEICSTEEICADVCARTGLHPDAYFSASKIRWILDNTPGARERAEAGELAFGTVDSWLIWNLTGATATAGAVHATDRTNASRTMLYNIHEAAWDPTLLALFDVPEGLLPKVLPSSALFGRVASGPLAGVPICGVAGDQQAALFGQCCFDAGQAKNTYGTGCFLLMHTGTDAKTSTNNLVTTIAATAPESAFIPSDKVEYALEGSVFIAGALVKWMVEELQILENPPASAAVAMSVEDS